MVKIDDINPTGKTTEKEFDEITAGLFVELLSQRDYYTCMLYVNFIAVADNLRPVIFHRIS